MPDILLFIGFLLLVLLCQLYMDCDTLLNTSGSLIPLQIPNPHPYDVIHVNERLHILLRLLELHKAVLPIEGIVNGTLIYIWYSSI